MDGTHVFSSKAEKYAKYRWHYAPQAIQAIFEKTKITKQSWVADIGAGTGILTRALVGRVGLIFTVEPNPEMRAVARRELEHYPACRVIDGQAEATTLPDYSLDLITAAQATNWFEPQAARQEFRRILKPGGWLAVLRNYGMDQAINEAVEKIYPPETDTGAIMSGIGTPRSFYYEGGTYTRLEFPFTSRLTWESFFGALCTASYAPDETSPTYTGFELAARRVFDRFNFSGLIELHSSTELYLGQMVGKPA